MTGRVLAVCRALAHDDAADRYRATCRCQLPTPAREAGPLHSNTIVPVPLRRLEPRAAAVLFAAGTSLAFLLTRPAVGDFWAAQARESAAAHGVGLGYWFSWFAGTVPGHYSVLSPVMSRIINPGALGAASTVVVTALSYVLLRGTRHPVAGTWMAAIGSSFSLWSGRVPFALGTALMLVALLAVRHRRPSAGVVAGAASALTSPVSAVFLIVGLCGIVVHDRDRRSAALAVAGAAGVCLLGLAVYFGIPGPEDFGLGSAAVSAAAVAVTLLARPPAYVRTVVLVSLAACPILALVPNGMGSNFERFAWLCLPVAVVSTARARTSVAVATSALALSCGVIGSLGDLYIAAQPMSSTAYYNGLLAKLDGIRGLDDYRVEVVPDGAHVAAYALLDHAQLARGYETQSDNELNAVLNSPTLDAGGFRKWLDDNAVSYVVLDRTTLMSGPEDTLVRSGELSYLRQVWSDSHLRLFAVTNPQPIVGAPGRIRSADQAQMTVSTPEAGRLALRLRWSRFLHVTAAGAPYAQVEPDGSGWTVLVVSRPGQYVLTG